MLQVYVSLKMHLLLFAGGFYIGGRVDIAFDGSVRFFKLFDVCPYQYKHLTVYASAFVVGYVRNFAQHFLFDSDGDTLDGHIFTSK